MGNYVEMPRTITKPLDKAIVSAGTALDKLDDMLNEVFEREAKDFVHIKQDMKDVIATMQNVKRIVNEFYKENPIEDNPIE